MRPSKILHLPCLVSSTTHAQKSDDAIPRSPHRSYVHAYTHRCKSPCLEPPPHPHTWHPSFHSPVSPTSLLTRLLNPRNKLKENSAPRTHQDLTSSKVQAPGSTNIQPPAQSELTNSLVTGPPKQPHPVDDHSDIPDPGAAIAALGFRTEVRSPETSGFGGDMLGSSVSDMN